MKVRKVSPRYKIVIRKEREKPLENKKQIDAFEPNYAKLTTSNISYEKTHSIL